MSHKTHKIVHEKQGPMRHKVETPHGTGRGSGMKKSMRKSGRK